MLRKALMVALFGILVLGSVFGDEWDAIRDGLLSVPYGFKAAVPVGVTTWTLFTPSTGGQFLLSLAVVAAMSFPNSMVLWNVYVAQDAGSIQIWRWVSFAVDAVPAAIAAGIGILDVFYSFNRVSDTYRSALLTAALFSLLAYLDTLPFSIETNQPWQYEQTAKKLWLVSIPL